MNDENIKSSLGLLFVFIGGYLLYTVILLKIDLISQKTEAHIEKISADLRWEDFLYRQTLEEVGKNK